ncbi:1-acylglycerol-3-phosphate O-acyltransferase [Thalassotalea sp. ND16A]|uniref:1-acylglycerol-3-phosphate O-acyltransferase n=1 Tax=Thalassotalea sp. ND16A TaxID=1535422 RepID=UPI00051A6444|nr:1-acylglycerol-3-phosphate O-acyltransferase [Thalassotalea sp. ND16A]KGJ89334.1 hypothetical protein ND16A_2227 [Thalassotalea sp. ND16A]
MLAVVRIFLVSILLTLISLTSIVMCMLVPNHRSKAHYTAIFVGKLAKIFGIDVEIRKPKGLDDLGPVVYVANHQNSYDIFTVSASLPKRTVSVGKKSLKWIPFFGQMYWFTGNILLDRGNRSKAHGTITATAEKMKERQTSVWLFPEGTRSYGRGLLPFKTGAFHTAKQAGSPIVPVCVSNTHDMVDLNRWDNGKMIIEFLSPIQVEDDSREAIRKLANHTHEIMLAKIKEISVEAGNELVEVDSKKVGK